jgi:D-alanyl-D-alanine carboxypeptidase-like protein
VKKTVLVALAYAAFALGVCVTPGGAQEQAVGWRQRAATEEILCNEQRPHDFLIRESWQVRGRLEREEIDARRAIHANAIRFRTENYGYFDGFGQRAWNARTPMQNATGVRFFDRPVRINQRIVAAARCAEQEVARSCQDTYQPQRLSGIRPTNTYHNNEVSNHVYGIAIDLDPTRNTCCNCVEEWQLHPMCQMNPRSIFERMVMPECWVRSFEKYGFYWLGHDRLMDTMHFEFLGDPEHILRSSGPPPHMRE